MERRTIHDELDAMASGTLSPEEAAALRKRCAEDPALGALLEEFLDPRPQAQGESAPPPCRLSFEDVVGALAPKRAWRMVLRRVVAAAAVLVLVGTGFFLARTISGGFGRSDGGEAGRPLRLAAIPPAAEAAVPGTEVPAALADYRPVQGGKVEWFPSFAAAEAVARASSRPVLLFIFHPACCICTDMREGTFTDAEVQERLDGFVPALVDVRTVSPALLKLAGEGFPWLGAVDPDGRVILSFPGGRGAVEFADRLKEAAALVAPPVFASDDLHALTRRLRSGEEAEKSGELAKAIAQYEYLAREVRGLPMGAAAEAGRSASPPPPARPSTPRSPCRRRTPPRPSTRRPPVSGTPPSPPTSPPCATASGRTGASRRSSSARRRARRYPAAVRRASRLLLLLAVLAVPTRAEPDPATPESALEACRKLVGSRKSAEAAEAYRRLFADWPEPPRCARPSGTSRTT